MAKKFATGCLIIALVCLFLLDSSADRYLLYTQENGILSTAILLSYPGYCLLIFFIRLLMVLEELSKLKTRHENLLSNLFSYCMGDLCDMLPYHATFFIIYLILLWVNFTMNKTVDLWQMLGDISLPYILAIFIISCLEVTGKYSFIEVDNGFKNIPSIGEVWAKSQISHLEKVLKDIPERIKKFEEKGVPILLRKLVIIMPLSCDVPKIFDEIDPSITYVGHLDILFDDQGANINRIYKNPVYKIMGGGKQFHVVMESPNTALALRKIKDVYKNHGSALWEYQRDQFISELKKKLRLHPCEILVYDDTRNGPLVPLSEFLRKELYLRTQNKFFGH